MQEYLMQIVKMIDPFSTDDDILEIEEINEWDVLIKFKDGKRIVYDRFTGYYKNIFYDKVNEITEEQEKKEFSYQLRNLIKRAGYTQQTFAEALGVSQPMISKYMTGESIPSAIMLRKMSKILNCSMDDFFYKQY